MPKHTQTGRKVAAAFSEVKSNEPAIVSKTRAKKGEAAAGRQKVAIALSKARAAGANVPKAPKNPPIFPVPNDEGMEGIIPKENEPLLGPREASVNAGSGDFAGVTARAFYANQEAKPELTPPHPAQPLRDSDFHEGGFTKGTSKAGLDTGGIV